MSAAEEMLVGQLRVWGWARRLPEWQREFQFHPKRRWKADFAFPDALLLVEIEGGAFTGGRHTRGVGFTKDCEKQAEAMCLGYKVLRVTPAQVKSGQALDWIMRLLDAKKPPEGGLIGGKKD